MTAVMYSRIVQIIIPAIKTIGMSMYGRWAGMCGADSDKAMITNTAPNP
jgi:hypothetical protein